MISLVTFAKSRVVTGWFFELWGGSLPDAHPSPVRHVELPTFLTTHEPEMPRLSRKAAQSSPSRQASCFIRATPTQSTPIGRASV
jgi:hypothetical protein